MLAPPVIMPGHRPEDRWRRGRRDPRPVLLTAEKCTHQVLLKFMAVHPHISMRLAHVTTPLLTRWFKINLILENPNFHGTDYK